MNYSNHDCRLRPAGSKLARLFRRKPARKTNVEKRGNPVLAALRAVTQIGAAVFALSSVASAQNSVDYYLLQPDEAASKDAKTYKFLPMAFSTNLQVIGSFAGDHQFRSLIQFELGALTVPINNITLATLELYCSVITPFNDTATPPQPIPGTGPGTVSLYQVNSAWGETSVTWDTFPSFSLTAEASQTVETAGRWYSFNITDIVKEWASGTTTNNGLAILMDTPTGNVTLSGAGSFAAGQAPRLTVVPEPGSALLALAGAGACILRRRRALAA